MTGVRQSIVFQIEDTFGEGCPAFEDEVGLPKFYWVHAPPGSWFSSTHRRDVKRIQSMGSKFWDTVAYGPLNGTWEWTFYLDYRYPEPLFLIFEGNGNSNVKARNVLSFTKGNNLRIPSFVVRVKQLDTVVDGLVNEVHTLKGCVVTNATFTKQSNSSYVQVRMSGFYSTESLKTYDDELMNTTDYVDYDGSLVEYACLTSEQLSGKEFNNASLIQNTDSVTIGIANSAEAIYNTCAPFALNYAEGLTKITLSASSYANHPTYYQYGVMSGGKDFNLIDVLAGDTLYPGAKNMAPLSLACLTSYNAMARDTSGIIGRAYAQSTLSSEFRLSDVVLTAITHQKGDSGKLMDSVSNCPVRLLELVLKSTMDPYTLSVGEDAWRDRFYYVPDESDAFRNNVFEEKTSMYQDEQGIIYRLDNEERTASLFALPKNFSGDVNGHLEIPPYITNEEGKAFIVTEISEDACRNTTERPVTIRSVHIPPTVETVGLNAFRTVSTLESVTGGLPTEEYPDGGVKTIYSGAFMMSSTASSLTVCDMVSDESTALEEVYPYAFTYSKISSLYISSTCKYYMSSASNPYQIGVFSLMGTAVQEIKLPLSLNVIGTNADGTLFQGLFYKTYPQKFVFYQDSSQESMNYVSSEYDMPVGGVTTADANEQVISANMPSLATPWYQSRKKRTDAVYVEFDKSVKDVPDGMFLIPDDLSRKYTIDPTAYSAFKSIGAYSFYNSCDISSGDGVLNLKCGIGQYAFYKPVGVTKLKISHNLTSMGANIVVFDADDPDDDLAIIDLGGCTRCTTVRNSFKGVAGVVQVVMPPSIKYWYSSAVLATDSTEDGWYRLGKYNADSTEFTKFSWTNIATGRISTDYVTYLQRQVLTIDGQMYAIPRRFFRDTASQEDQALGAAGALNTVDWVDVTWNDVSNTKWNVWSQYMWGEVGQYRRYIPNTLSMSSPSPSLETLQPGVTPINPVNPGMSIQDIDRLDEPATTDEPAVQESIQEPVQEQLEEQPEEQEDASEESGEFTIM